MVVENTMDIGNLRFNEYYHQFMTFEADALTEKCADRLSVSTDDCYALCSSWINDEGEIMFNVLSIGPTWETCTKGLDLPEMLASFTMEEVMDCQVRIVIPDFEMMQKNASFLEHVEHETDEELIELRQDDRLDDLRDRIYPDLVELTYFNHGQIQLCLMKLRDVQGPFICGEIVEPEETDLPIGEKTYALPYIGPDGIGLLRVYGDDTMDEDEHEMLHEIIHTAEEYGFGFDGYRLKN